MFPILQAAVLIGLGMCIESPAKREKIIKALDGAGKYAEKMLGDFFPKGGGVNVPEPPDEYR